MDSSKDWTTYYSIAGLVSIRLWLRSMPSGPFLSPQVIEYKSTRDLETFSKFLDSGGDLPEEEPKEPAVSTPVGSPFRIPAPLNRFSPRMWAEAGLSWASVILSRKHKTIPPWDPRRSCSHMDTAFQGVVSSGAGGRYAL